MKRFYLWLCRWSFKKLKADTLNGFSEIPVGVPFMRDPDHKCEAYSPRKRKTTDWYCNGDGHYLCHECALYKPEENQTT